MKFAASAFAAFAGLACASPVMTTALGARGLTLGEILAPILKFLDCNVASPEIKLLCEAVADKVNLELKQAGFTISSGGLLFQYFDDTDVDVDTGHSCTITAQVQSTEASARIDQSASIDLSGNPLSGAALLAIKLPIYLSATAHVKQRFGQRLLGSCINLGSDSFDVSGRLSTTAKVAIFFAIAPSLRTDVNGDYVLTIKPLIKVSAELQNTEVLATDISGQSPFSGLVAMLVGGPSSTLKAVTNLLEGDSVKSVFEGLLKGLAIDLGLGIAFTLPPGVLDDLLKIFAQKVVEDKLKAQASKYTATLQAKLQGDLARVLQLDVNGERHLTIRKDFYDLLVRLGKGADIYLPTKPAGYCASNADCDDGNFCNGVERCVGEKCVAGTRPCVGRERCNASARTCTEIDNCGGTTRRVCPKDYVGIR